MKITFIAKPYKSGKKIYIYVPMNLARLLDREKLYIVTLEPLKSNTNTHG